MTSPHTPSVAVIGLGSIGGIVAGSLAAAGRCNLTLCVRRAISRLDIERPEDRIDVPVRALTDPAEAEPADWVLIATKAQQTASTAPWLARLCGPGTRVATLQNGIGHAARLAPFVGGAAVVPTVVYFNGERFAPDHMRFRRAGSYELAVADDENGHAFADLMAGTPMRILMSGEFPTLVWKKLLINAVANPVTALTLQRQGVFRRADVRDLCLGVLEEAASVGRAEGAPLAADAPLRTMDVLATHPADAGTSMYFDRLAGNALEIEALTGEIVAAAERHGIPVPFNRALLTLLRVVSDAAEA
ncbi:MAG: 2-dehydropantoate 2-reductase [Rhodospirillaceae bacterium]